VARVRYDPADWQEQPRFARLRLGQWRGGHHGSRGSQRLWEGECRKCGTLVAAQGGTFRADAVACPHCGASASELGAQRGESGVFAEWDVWRDLVARGYRAYAPVVPAHRPDVVALDALGRHLTIEVRRVRKNGHHHRKPGDHCDHYAWVHQDGRIEYEPPLPTPVEGLSGSPARTTGEETG
jgi:hypothetical protein